VYNVRREKAEAASVRRGVSEFHEYEYEYIRATYAEGPPIDAQAVDVAKIKDQVPVSHISARNCVHDIQDYYECDKKLECLWVSIMIMPEVQPCLRECQTKERSTEKQPDKNGPEGGAGVHDG